MPRKIPLRFTLMTLMLLLLGMTVSVIGIVSYLHARFTANDLAAQLLDQTQERIDQEIDTLLDQAVENNTLTLRRLESGRLRPDDFPALIGMWRDLMEVNPELSGCFIGLESTGASTGISRLSGNLSVWESHFNPSKKIYEVREYDLRDYPRNPHSTDLDQGGPDIRLRPWYVSARDAGKSLWTESYVFQGVKGVRDIHGITYATPIHDKNGKLLGVLDADFELGQLCRYLQGLHLGDDGLAFVVEQRKDGSRKVIAHPDEKLLFDKTSNPPRLRSPEEFPDARVSGFASLLPSRRNGSKKAAAALHFEGGKEPHLGTYRETDKDSDPPWLICVVLPEGEVLGRVHRNNRFTILIGVGVLILSVLLSLYISAEVARPLEKLAKEAGTVGRLELQANPVPHSIIREVDDLAVAMEDMKGGLRSFQKYVPADLVRSLVASGKEAGHGGELRTVTIFFSDIANFTAISEDLDPQQLVERLREYLTALSKEIHTTNGTVDKYIGDAIMAFWGAPSLHPQHAVAACTAALRCQHVLRELRTHWESQKKTPFHTRIGIHTGEVVVGNIGSDTRLNYTVIGNSVNLASRLEGLNKYYGTNILISESTCHEAKAVVTARPLDYVSVKGKKRPVLIYELLGLQSEGNESHHKIADLSGQALSSYRRQDWTTAIRLFEEVLTLQPNDPTALMMLSRCRAYLESPPGPDWDGVYHLTSK